jgi:hypothetical protein
VARGTCVAEHPRTGGRAAGRFFMSLFRKRQIVTDADLA